MPLSESRLVVDNAEHWRRFFANDTGATDRALVASTEPYVEWMRASLLEGYTTGEYVTGAASASVYVTEVRDEADGTLSVGITTDLDYPWMWEFGFHHAGNGQYYRVEKWGPGLEATAPECERRFRESMASETF